MSRRFLVVGSRARVLTGVVVMATMLHGGAASAEEPKVHFDVTWRIDSSAEKKIRAALTDGTTLEFIETPLKDVVDYLKDLHGIEIQFDTKSLDGVGVSTDTPVTRNIKGVSLRSALNLILRDLNLTFVVRNEVLEITTPAAVAADVSVKTHAAADLIPDEAAAKALTATVEMALDPPATSRNAEKASPAGARVVPFRGLLLVRGSLHEHERVGELLSHVRQVLKQTAPKAGPAPSGSGPKAGPAPPGHGPKAIPAPPARRSEPDPFAP